MYVSLDLETGGLNYDMDILQIAAVKWDHEDIMKCSYVDIIIKLPYYRMEPYAAWLNRDILKRVADGEGVDGYDEAWDMLEDFIGDKVFAVGKNVSGFDLRFIENHGFPVRDYFHYRALDVGTFFATPEGIPSLSGVLNQVSLPKSLESSGKLHDALWDARVCLHIASEYLRVGR